jgi:hypothetical protein
VNEYVAVRGVPFPVGVALIKVAGIAPPDQFTTTSELSKLLTSTPLLSLKVTVNVWLVPPAVVMLEIALKLGVGGMTSTIGVVTLAVRTS